MCDVTVCIATLGRAAALRQLVEKHLLAQTCGSFKVLIKNNNVDDITFTLPARRPFTVAQLPPGNRKGVAESRQMLLQAADTKYVLFFDDDDVPLPRMVETMVAAAEATNADLVSSACENYNKQGGYVHTSLTTGFVGLAPEYAEHLAGKAAVLVRREFALQHGGIPSSTTFAGRKLPYRDYLMYVVFLAQGAKLTNYPLPLYRYTQHSEQSLFYGATARDRMLARWEVQTQLCKHLNLRENVCQIVRQVT